ncbi:MAG: hypothetical protein PWR13_674 [Archaeoglobi archaeon]|nr:hypothetical protein [Candidatus Mnemosynella bozhongmuii]MDI3502308.1 hypothetical protein [Archaeoglobi archaeon]MDK2781646.1 hypothetical protein [Archaeoglobi archaeon]
MRVRDLIRELRSGELSAETKSWLLRRLWLISLFMLLLGYTILFLLLFGERFGISLR